MNNSLATMPSKSIKSGQMWELGDHRLLCGNATIRADVERLVGTDRVSLLLTDPPYGVAYVEDKQQFLNVIHKANKNIQRFNAIQGDQMEQDYYTFSKNWLEPIKSHVSLKNSFYVFNGDTKLREFLNALHDAGYYKSELLIWVKNNIVVGRKDFHPRA